MKNEMSIMVNERIQEILDLYRRGQEKIPSKKQALSELVKKGWEAAQKEKKI